MRHRPSLQRSRVSFHGAQPVPGSALLLATALLPALGACRSTADASVAEVVSLAQHGAFAEAHAEARRLAALDPQDAALQRLVLDAEVAWVLDRGRRALFEDRVEEALELFREAREVDPANPVVSQWITKTKLQLAERELDRATAARAEERFDEAEAAFEAVLALLPEGRGIESVERARTQAQLGLAEVLLHQNYRDGQSRSYYQEGIRDFREFWLGRAQHDFGASLLYDSENHRARARLDEVEDVLADERLAKAAALEADGLFHAAGKEYRLALLLDPGNAQARAGFDRMDLETRTERTLGQAQMNVHRGELERAEELLRRAEQFTEEQTDEVGRLAAEIEEERLRRAYEEARSLERDYRYLEAAAAYRTLLEEVEFYEDAIARLSTIEEFIALAERYYTAAMDAESEEERVDFLRRIPVFWPEYRDVEQRLAEYDARVEESADDTPSDDPSDG